MKLEIDPRSPTWRFVEQHATKRLTELRLKNDRMSMGPDETAHTRGQIAVLKELLALPETAAPAQPAGDQH
ncbi:hypothetical protein VLK31_07115 [Variovorax sp. H27-G14]|uniref:hypothetical protein n=1 Tax=Variovorax sp. H27-G14 TaxID=3111914 RepID=UPI0038FD3417